MLICCKVPGATVNVDGEALTPSGKPEIESVTGAMNPFLGDALTIRCRGWAPGVTVKLPGPAESSKSADKKGVVVPGILVPHPVIKARARSIGKFQQRYFIVAPGIFGFM
jgi:hypothetical protein